MKPSIPSNLVNSRHVELLHVISMLILIQLTIGWKACFLVNKRIHTDKNSLLKRNSSCYYRSKLRILLAPLLLTLESAQ